MCLALDFVVKQPSEIHSAIMWIKSVKGSYYHTEQCTARFTDNFGITKHLIKYQTTESDQESSFEHRKAQTSENTSERQTHNCTGCKEQNNAFTTSLNQIQLISTEIFILPNWLWASKAANVFSTGFCCKATIRTAFCYYVNWVRSRFILRTWHLFTDGVGRSVKRSVKMV